VNREQNIVNQKSICLGASLLSGRGVPIASSSRTCFPARFTFNFREPEPETHVLQMLRVFPNATVAHFTQDILQRESNNFLVNFTGIAAAAVMPEGSSRKS